MTDRTPEQIIAAPRHARCCLCGAPRGAAQQPVESFGNNVEIVIMKHHRPLRDGRWEESPQMLVNVSMWRNGGTARGQTHICDDCIVVGLKVAQRFIDGALVKLDAADAEVKRRALLDAAQEG